MKYGFEVPVSELTENLNQYASVVLSSLESEFLVMPKGQGFIEYPVFEEAYEFLKKATNGFQNIESGTVIEAAFQFPMVIIVLRTMVGFTPPEWAYLASRHTSVDVPQGFARSLDRGIRMAPLRPLSRGAIGAERVRALIATACALLNTDAPNVGNDRIHRLDKADTRGGPDAIRVLSTMGVPYAMLLYERFLGRPFAGHRDSVSERIGDSLEVAIEEMLSRWGVSYRKTKRAERIPGFDQAPDFVIPSEFNPQVVIEAKITEDDGTARDKVTRVQHLASLSMQGPVEGVPRFEVIACIGGRGFGVRREDMKKLLLATRGKVFTLHTLHRLVESSRLVEFSSTKPESSEHHSDRPLS